MGGGGGGGKGPAGAMLGAAFGAATGGLGMPMLGAEAGLGAEAALGADAAMGAGLGEIGTAGMGFSLGEPFAGAALPGLGAAAGAGGAAGLGLGIPAAGFGTALDVAAGPVLGGMTSAAGFAPSADVIGGGIGAGLESAGAGLSSIGTPATAAVDYGIGSAASASPSGGMGFQLPGATQTGALPATTLGAAAGVTPGSLVNTLSEMAGSPLGRLASLASNAYGYMQNQELMNKMMTGAHSSTTTHTQQLTPQQQKYQQQLAALLANPSSIFDDPAFQASLEQGRKGVERSNAMYGASGRMAQALQDYAQSAALKWYQQQLANYSSMVPTAQNYTTTTSGTSPAGLGGASQVLGSQGQVLNSMMGNIKDLMGQWGY